MEKPLYPNALAKRDIAVLVPDADDRAYVDDVIYNELVAGQVREESRAGFIRVIDKLVAHGAEGVILGCTEIPLLVNEEDVRLPLFDTTTLHAQAALEFAVD
jgi:aspartate racemase